MGFSSPTHHDHVLRNQAWGRMCNRSALGSPVVHAHPHQDIVGLGLRIFDLDVEIAVVVEQPGVDELELRFSAAASPRILVDEALIRVGALRELVEHARVAVAGDSIEVVVDFLDVLAVVALRVGQPEEALLEDGILAVPQGQGEAQELVVVAESGNAVLAPAIGAASRMVVGEVIPGRAVRAVILAHRAPLALADIGTPAAPVDLAVPCLEQALAFRIECHGHVQTSAFVDWELCREADGDVSRAFRSCRHASRVQATDHAWEGAPRG